MIDIQRCGVVGALLLTLAAPASALAKCSLQTLAELPVNMLGGQPNVKVSVNGHDERFAVRSGWFWSTISATEAKRIGLKLEHANGFQIRQRGGSTDAYITKTKDFFLAGIPLPGQQLVVTDVFGGELAGELGEDILGLADVDYDLGNGVIRLIKPTGCASSDGLAYWAANGAVEMPLTNSATSSGSVFNRRIKARGALNGQPIVVSFDTANSRSMISIAAAAKAGVTPTSPGSVPSSFLVGLGSNSTPTWIGQFQALSLGGETIQKIGIRFGNFLADDYDMVLGTDFFLSHRVYVSNSQKKIYFTYNGGPVFNLDSQKTASKPANIPKTDDESSPKDANSLLGRGTAYAARGNLDAASATMTAP